MAVQRITLYEANKKRLEAQMFNKPKMIIRSTKLDLITEPFLLVLLKRVLCSRCGLSAQNFLRSDTLRFLIFSFLVGQLNHLKISL